MKTFHVGPWELLVGRGGVPTNPSCRSWRRRMLGTDGPAASLCTSGQVEEEIGRRYFAGGAFNSEWSCVLYLLAWDPGDLGCPTQTGPASLREAMALHDAALVKAGAILPPDEHHPCSCDGYGIVNGETCPQCQGDGATP